MELKEAVEDFLATVLQEFSYHPLIAPYLNASRENPPQHYMHQCEVTARLALRKPIRVLIGDEIGLGKTITALSTTKYLEKLDRAHRILIVVPRVLVWQWHRELTRMGIPESKIKHLESHTIEFLKFQNFPEAYYIASMDLLKREERIKEIIDVQWDVIIVDEVHKFGYKTKRFWEIGKNLVEMVPSRDILFLSATPHRGDPKDYILRLQLLDPHLVEGWRALDRRHFYQSTHGAILFRRTKEDVNKVYEEKEIFPKARFYACVIKARQDEATFVRELVEFLRSKLIEFAYERGLISERVIPLLRVLIFKRAASSPYAAWTTLQRLLERRVAPNFTAELIDSVKSFLETGYEDYEYEEKDPEEVFNEFLDRTAPLLSPTDKEQIRKLRDMAKQIIEEGDSKLNGFISLLEDIMAEEKSKVIIFTEYKDTLNYILQNLKKRHPEWDEKVVLRLSSDETKDADLFRRIRNAFETNPKARVLIATDVVAEGINLQVAHILVNYEIPWSLIKLEQRIGRVWRLGQEREVEAYTLFMDNVADVAALNSMYRKLINLKRAELYPRPVTGQEVLLYAEAADLMKIPPSVSLTKEAKKRKFTRVTEAKTILTFIREGVAGLNRLIASILAAKREIEKDLAAKGVLHKPVTKKEVEYNLELLGFRNPQELFKSFRSLVKAASEFLGFKVFEEENLIRIVKGLEMPFTLSTLDDYYGLLIGEGIEKLKEQSKGLVAYGETEKLLALIPVQVKDRKTDTLLYRELIGVYLDEGQVIRGATLLNLLAEALSSCIGVLNWDFPEKEMSLTLLTDVMESLRKPSSSILEPITRYANNLERLKLRNKEKLWVRLGDLEVNPSESIGYIRFVKKPIAPPEKVPEEVKRKIEEEAIKIVMETEKRENRKPQRVPITEHYDVKSIDPSTSEVRLIEVKGHKGHEVHGELTNKEAELAEKEQNKYWLYIVYNIGSEKPKLLRFQNPLRTMNWKIFERVERRYLLWPKALKEATEIG